MNNPYVPILVLFLIGAGFAVPTQLFFVPLFALAPAPVVPLLVVAGLALARLVDIARGQAHVDRLVLSGGNAIRAVQAVGVARTFLDVFANTVLVKDGAIKATSLQNVAPGGANINCIVNKADGTFLGNINNQATFLDLDGVADKAVETDVSAFTIKCNSQ